MNGDMMMFREIEFGSADFRKECDLRHEVLRAPLGLRLLDEDLSGEREQIHFGLFDPSDNLRACVIAAPLSPDKAKIRQMAVHRTHQGQGLGRIILAAAEADLARRGFLHLVLHARRTAVGFYEHLGYSCVGPGFIEVGIPHVKMEKTIQSGSDSHR